MSDHGHAEIKDNPDTSHHDHRHDLQATHSRRSSRLDPKIKQITYVTHHSGISKSLLMEIVSVMLMPNWQTLCEEFRAIN
jgi:hypothetical protein